jgi:hypothetical protein
MNKTAAAPDRSSVVRDIIAIIICLAGAALSIKFFYDDFYRTMEKQADPVGSITYKHQAVQRRFGDRVLWQRLSRGSPVYSEDLIRTAEYSEATIYLAQGPGIELAENTLIQVRLVGDQLTLNLSNGGLSVSVPDSSSSASSLVLLSGRNRVELSAGSSISASSADDGRLKLQVSEGSVVMSGNGELRELRAGEFYSDDPGESPQAAAIAPRSNTRIFSTGAGLGRPRFSWSTHFYPPGGLSVLEIATDRRFARSVKSFETPNTELETDLEPGVYWWRVFPAGTAATARGSGEKLTVVRVSAPVVVSPREGYAYPYTGEGPQVLFQWAMPAALNDDEGSPDFLLEAADNPAMSNSLISLRVQGAENKASLIYSGFGPGRWYWRVSPLYPGYEGPPPTVLSSFSVRQRGENPPPPEPVSLPPESPPARPAPEPPPRPVVVEPSPPPRPPPPTPPPRPPQIRPVPLASPVLRQPADELVLGVRELRQSRSLFFQWDPVAGADAYVFAIFTGEGRQLLETRIRAQSSYTLTDLRTIGRGNFVWRVEAQGIGEDGKAGRGPASENHFTVDVPAPAVPRARDPGILYGE